MDHSNPFKPIPSLPAYSIPCSEPSPVRSYASAGRQHRLRRRRLLSRGRSSTLRPEEARAARRDDVILDRGHLHLFCRQMHAFVAFHRPAQPALCSRPSCSPGHRSPCSLSSLSRCCTPPWRPPRAQGRRFRASPGRTPSSDASSASGPKKSAPAAGRGRSWRPPDGTAGAIECGFPTELGVLFIGGRCGGQVKNCPFFFYCRNG